MRNSPETRQRAPEINYQQFQNDNTRYKALERITRNEVIGLIRNYPELMKEYSKNTEKTQQRTIQVLMRQPTTADCPGFVYGFRDFSQYKKNPNPTHYDIKMGKTKLDVPENRIHKWQKQDGHEYVQIFTVRTEHNSKLESLVHLFFAYARKQRIINGKRRIEWFTFDQKTLNAVVTALIDSLMQQIHELSKTNRQKCQQISFNFNSFIQRAHNEIKDIQITKNKVILMGPKYVGKSTLKYILNKVPIIAENSSDVEGTGSFKIQGSQFVLKADCMNLHQIKLSPQILEMKVYSRSMFRSKVNFKEILKVIEQSFVEWTRLYSTQDHPVPLLVMKQSDLMSSEMMSAIRILQEFQRYYRLSTDCLKQLDFKLILAVTQSASLLENGSIEIYEEKVSKYVSQHIECFQNLQLVDFLCNHSSFVGLSLPKDEGKFEVAQIYAKIQRILMEQSNKKSSELKKPWFQYFQPAFGQNKVFIQTLQQSILNSCEQISEKYSMLLKEKLKKISKQPLNKEEDDDDSEDGQKLQNEISTTYKKSQFLLLVKGILQTLQQSESQRQIFRETHRLISVLSIEIQEECTPIFFITFCECMVKLQSIRREKQQVRSQTQDNIQNQNSQRLFETPINYMSSSMQFSGLYDQISETSTYIRQEYNYFIENLFEQNCESILKDYYEFHSQEDEKGKENFERTFNLLEIMVNYSATNVNTNNPSQMKTQTQEDFIIDILKQIVEMMTKDYLNEYVKRLTSVINAMKILEKVKHIHKININNVVARVRVAIYGATEDRKPIKANSKGSKDRQNKEQKKVSNPKSPGKSAKKDIKQKIITHKNDQSKDQKLLNFLNKNLEDQEETRQRKFQPSLPRDIPKINQKPEKKNMNQPISLMQGEQSDSSQIFYPSLGSSQLYASHQSEDVSLIEQLQQLDIQEKKESGCSKNVNQMKSEEKKKSSPSKNPQSGIEQIEELIVRLDTLQPYKIDEKYLSDESFMFFNEANMKSLQESLLDLKGGTQGQQQLIFNYFETSFSFDVQNVKISQSIVLFAKRVDIEQLCDITFKAPYQDKKLNFIIMAQIFENLHLLTMQKGKRFIKSCLVQVYDRQTMQYQILGVPEKQKKSSGDQEYEKIEDLKEQMAKQGKWLLAIDVKNMVRVFCENVIQ